MTFVVLNILVALLNGFGAVQLFIVGGLVDREVGPLLIGLAGIAVSVLFLISAFAMWRKWPNAGKWSIVAAISSIVFHVYAALPPHRFVGMVALLIGAGYGVVLLIYTLSKGKKAEPVIG